MQLTSPRDEWNGAGRREQLNPQVTLKPQFRCKNYILPRLMELPAGSKLHLLFLLGVCVWGEGWGRAEGGKEGRKGEGSNAGEGGEGSAAGFTRAWLPCCCGISG